MIIGNYEHVECYSSRCQRLFADDYPNLTLVIYVNSINFGNQTEHLQPSFSCPQVLAESGCVTTDCRIDVYFDDRLLIKYALRKKMSLKKSCWKLKDL